MMRPINATIGNNVVSTINSVKKSQSHKNIYENNKIIYKE